MCQSVLGGLSKSTSNLLYGAPFGFHCTEMMPMLGGTRTPSVGYTSVMGGAADGQAGAVIGGNLQPLQSGVVTVPMAVVTPGGSDASAAAFPPSGSVMTKPPPSSPGVCVPVPPPLLLPPRPPSSSIPPPVPE